MKREMSMRQVQGGVIQLFIPECSKSESLGDWHGDRAEQSVSHALLGLRTPGQREGTTTKKLA